MYVTLLIYINMIIIHKSIKNRRWKCSNN